jgi:hypothetical protein
MKLLLLFSLSTLASSFSPTPALSLWKASSLSMASKDDWSDKPIPQRKSSKPVPVRDVSWVKKKTLPDTMVAPNFYLTWAMAILGGLILWYHPCKFMKGVTANDWL